jgi:hypothetical protein
VTAAPMQRESLEDQARRLLRAGRSLQFVADLTGMSRGTLARLLLAPAKPAAEDPPPLTRARRRYGPQTADAAGRVQCNAGLIDRELWQQAKAPRRRPGRALERLRGRSARAGAPRRRQVSRR